VLNYSEIASPRYAGLAMTGRMSLDGRTMTEEGCHCEERSDEAISTSHYRYDDRIYPGIAAAGFASLAMTGRMSLGGLAMTRSV